MDANDPVITSGGYRNESIACQISTKNLTGLLPLYKYFNGKDHLYTTSDAEIGTTTHGAEGNNGYKFEAIVGYCLPSQTCGATYLFRYYNGIDHLYTASAIDVGATVPGAIGGPNYRFQGVPCFVAFA